jgi:hypothetical protein
MGALGGASQMPARNSPGLKPRGISATGFGQRCPAQTPREGGRPRFGEFSQTVASLSPSLLAPWVQALDLSSEFALQFHGSLPEAAAPYGRPLRGCRTSTSRAGPTFRATATCDASNLNFTV